MYKTESICFKSIYLDGLTEQECADILNLTLNSVYIIRKSATIKFALALNLAVMKGE